MHLIYILGTVQYVPGGDVVLIPLQQVSPNADAPLRGVQAAQNDLAALTPIDLSDRSRWSDREAKAYATAFVRQNEPDAQVYTTTEWAEIQESTLVTVPSRDAVLSAAAAIADAADEE